MKRYIMITCTLFASCFLEETAKETYKIENGTDSKVEMNFFRQGVEVGITLSVDGRGVLFEREGLEFGSTVLPSTVLMADSITLNFDNTRLEKHFLEPGAGFVPENRFILEREAYLSKDGFITYIINQTNFDNATPCNGPCN